MLLKSAHAFLDRLVDCEGELTPSVIENFPQREVLEVMNMEQREFYSKVPQLWEVNGCVTYLDLLTGCEEERFEKHQSLDEKAVDV